MISREEFVNLFKVYICSCHCKKLITKFSYQEYFIGLRPYHFRNMNVSFWCKDNISFIKFTHTGEHNKTWFFRLPEDASISKIIDKYIGVDHGYRDINRHHIDSEKQFIIDIMDYLDKFGRDIGEMYDLK